jgi:hydroxyethylthiazole kinase-like uncharacterized protein yjeF
MREIGPAPYGRAAHRVETVRAAEAALMATLPPGTLMDRAAAGLATTCARLLGRTYGARVLLLVGSGDNGGDALYAGARLARRGVRVDALLFSPERAHAGGLAALRAAGGRAHPVTGDTVADRRTLSLFGHPDLVVDGIVGIGGRGGLREPGASLAEAACLAARMVVAVDVPSGIDASTGEVTGLALEADVTVTFGTYKPGLLVDPGATYAGVIELVDIGLRDLPSPDVTALSQAWLGPLLPEPSRESDKYRRGVVGVACGSATYPGAPVLTVGAALRSGVGAVRYSGPARAASAVRARWPEALVTEGSPADAGRVQAWIAGPGMDTDVDAQRRLDAVLESDVPVLLDADALTLLARSGPKRLAGRTAPVVITPHAGEAARLLDDDRGAIEARRLDAVRRLADGWGVTALLKGSTTLVAEPGAAAVRVNTVSTSQLATAGSGDVLSGLAGGLLAAGLTPADAASAGALLHGLAGRLAAAGGAPITAHDLIDRLPAAWAAARESGG